MDERLIQHMHRRLDDASRFSFIPSHSIRDRNTNHSHSHSSSSDGEEAEEAVAMADLRRRQERMEQNDIRNPQPVIHSDNSDYLDPSSDDASASDRDEDEEDSIHRHNHINHAAQPAVPSAANDDDHANSSQLLIDRAMHRLNRPSFPVDNNDVAEAREDAEWLWRSPVVNPSTSSNAAAGLGSAGASNSSTAATIVDRYRPSDAAQWATDALSARARAELAQQAGMQQRYQLMQQQQQLQREQVRFQQHQREEDALLQQLQQLEINSARLGLPASSGTAAASAAVAVSSVDMSATDLSASKGSNASSGASSTLEDLLRCFMCYGRVTQPHLCPHCSKIGCMGCWNSWFGQAVSTGLLHHQHQQPSAHHSCPCCRRPLSMDKLVNCRFMGELTAALGELGVVEAEETVSNKHISDKSTVNNGSSTSVPSKPARHNGLVAAGSSPCPVHPSQLLSYFCVSCSVALCSDCALFDSMGTSGSSISNNGMGAHRGHELARLDSIYAEHVSLVSSERDKVSSRLRKLNARAESVARNAAQLQRKREEAAHELHERQLAIENSLSKILQTKLSVLQEQKQSIAQESNMLSSLLSDIAQQLNPNICPKHTLISKSGELLNMLYDLTGEEDENRLGTSNNTDAFPRQSTTPVVLHGGGGLVDGMQNEGKNQETSSHPVTSGGPSDVSAPSSRVRGASLSAVDRSIASTTASVLSPSSISSISSAPLTFPSELVPEWYASPLVRIKQFQAKKQAASKEEEDIKQKKLEYQELIDKIQREHQRAVEIAQFKAEIASLGTDGIDGEEEQVDSQQEENNMNDEQDDPIGRQHYSRKKKDNLISPPPAPTFPTPPSFTPICEVIYSSPLWVCGQAWRLKLYPQGNGVARPQYISVFVELSESHLQSQQQYKYALEEATKNQQPVKELEEDCTSEDEQEEQCHKEWKPWSAPTVVMSSDGSAPSVSKNVSAVRPFPQLPPPMRSPPSMPSHANTYEYRVELLPHPAHHPLLSGILRAALCGGSDGAGSMLASQTMSSFLDSILFVHASNAPLVAAVQAYASKLVTRVFSSTFEHGEAWGYNRFFRIDLLKEEGYLGHWTEEELNQQDNNSGSGLTKIKVCAQLGQESGDNQSSEVNVDATASSSSSSSKLSSSDEDELLLRFYVRPPSSHLQAYEQRAWIYQLETHTQQQHKQIQRLQKQLQQQNKEQPPPSSQHSSAVPQVHTPPSHPGDGINNSSSITTGVVTVSKRSRTPITVSAVSPPTSNSTGLPTTIPSTQQLRAAVAAVAAETFPLHAALTAGDSTPNAVNVALNLRNSAVSTSGLPPGSRLSRLLSPSAAAATVPVVSTSVNGIKSASPPHVSDVTPPSITSSVNSSDHSSEDPRRKLGREAWTAVERARSAAKQQLLLQQQEQQQQEQP
jgi:hypothetical protein